MQQNLTNPELTASLSSLGKVCWMRLEYDVVRFTIIPDQGTQVWAQIPVVSAKSPTFTSNAKRKNIRLILTKEHNLRRRIIPNRIQLRRNQHRNQRRRSEPRLALHIWRLVISTPSNQKRQNASSSTHRSHHGMDRGQHGPRHRRRAARSKRSRW